MKLAFKHTLSHPVLPFTGEPHRLFVLIETSSSSPSQPLPMNLSLVIDCSDSMRILMVTNEQFNQLAKSGSIVEVITDGVPAWKIQDMSADQLGTLPRRIDYVAEALRVVSDRIRAIDHYSLVAFAQQAQTIIPTTTGKDLAREILNENIERGRIQVGIPVKLGFHSRPSLLVAKIVQYYGGQVELVIGEDRFDASSVLDIQWAGGKIQKENINQVIFEGDARALNDIQILAGVNYGEDTMGKGVPLPKELKYLR
jgi:phosphotransferase system HPr-like phosphotransfer protein